MATPAREMGLDKLELLTKSAFQDVETLKLLGADKCLGQLRSLQAAFLEGLTIVKTLFNTACPINRLPPEILAHIFARIPGRRSYGDLKPGGHWPFAQTIVEDLHALPKVCRSWRELALATPTLWTTVSTSRSVDDTDYYYFRHSIYLPEDPSLELRIHLESPEVVPRMEELLFRNARRIRELHHLVDLSDRELCEVLESFDANALEKCLLVAYSSDYSSTYTPPTRSQARFLPFFSGGGTRLRFLCISGSFLPANEFPALSCLMLCLDGEWPVHWDLWDLLKVISGSPGLEEIHVCDAWFATATSSHNTHGLDIPVPLPRLRYLSFEYLPDPGEPADVTTVDFLLSHITIPSTCHLYLSVPQASSGTNCAFLDSVRRHTPDKDRISHLALWFPDRLWECDYVALQLVFPNGSLRLLFSTPAQTRRGLPDTEGLLEFLRTHPDSFAWTTELRIHYNEEASLDGLSLLKHALPSIFPNIKLISTIGVEKWAELEAGLELLLQPSDDSPAGVGTGTIAYPALETLWVVLNASGLELELEADAARLKAALAARASQGCPIRRAIVAYRVPASQAPLELRQSDVRNLVRVALEGTVDEVVLMEIPSGERPEEVDWMVWYPEKYGLPADIRRDWPVWWRSG